MERKPFLLRLDPTTMSALRAWAGDDLRSLNGQIEFLLRRALREAGRIPPAAGARDDPVYGDVGRADRADVIAQRERRAGVGAEDG